MNEFDLDGLGQVIDNACDTFDEKELLLVLTFSEDYTTRVTNSTIKARLYYLLANAWGGLHIIRHKQDETIIWNYEQEEINQQIINLRKAKQEKGFSDLDIEYQCSVLTNLANIFSHTGRIVYAIDLYNQALSIEPNFFMASVNRGMCFQVYAGLDYDGGHKNIFLKLAYDDYKRAIDTSKLYHIDEYHSNVIEQCIKDMKVIESYISEECLISKLELDSFSFGNSDKEQEFRKWTLYNTIFLNPMNDIGFHNIASHDPLGLPSMVTRKQTEVLKYITYFNQLKQEYISFRHLLYEGVHRKTDEFYDKDTVIIDDLKLLNNDVDTEKIKLAFRGFYSIFDKISYFINEYYELDYEEHQINFYKIWRNKKELNDKFNNFENLALRGLYFISKDLFFDKEMKNKQFTEKHYENKEYIEILEPEAQKINNIRNHLEHKFINIKILDLTIKYEESKELSISLSDLEEKTLYLARLAREALTYLSFSIDIEENKKDRINGIFPMNLGVKG